MMSGRRNAVKVPLVILGVVSDLLGASALAGGVSVENWGLDLVGCAFIVAAIAMFVCARPPDRRSPARFQPRIPVLVFVPIFALLGVGAFANADEAGDPAQLWSGVAMLAVALAHAPFVFARNRYSDLVPPPERRLTPAPDALPSDWFDDY